MILEQVKTDTVFNVEAENLNQEKIETGVGLLLFDGRYSIYVKGRVYQIRILDESKLEKIGFYAGVRNYTALVNIIENLRDKKFSMEIVFFSYPVKEVYTKFYVSIDEKIMDTARKKAFIRHGMTLHKLSQYLYERVVLKINADTYFLISTSNASKDDVFEQELKNLYRLLEKNSKNEELNDSDKQEKSLEINEKLKSIVREMDDFSFTIHGDGFDIPVKKDIDESGDYRFKATRLISRKDLIRKDSLRLVRADLVFANGLMSEKIAKELEEIVEGEGSYLRKWDEYVEIEGNLLLEKARETGELLLRSFEKTADGYRLKFDRVPDSLQSGDYLELTSKSPPYLDPNVSWIQYMQLMDDRARFEKAAKVNKQVVSEKNQFFEITSIEHGLVNIRTDRVIKDFKDKKIVLSIMGDEIQIKRKFQARKRLQLAQSANPMLGLIIEDTDEEKIKKFLKTKVDKRLEPLTDYVRKKIFRNEPTQNQIDAIDIALNTPDIAVIQGPPGTGKTTVLTAIIERLNQESDKSGIMKGEILVAGFQHDAVENIIDRLEINGIVPPKFGKKSHLVIDMTSFERIMQWGEEIVENVRKYQPKLSKQLKIHQLRQYYQIYLRTPSEVFAASLLKHIYEDLSEHLDETIINQVIDLLEKMQKNKNDAINELKYIYALRTTQAGFLDDGPFRNRDLVVSPIGKHLGQDELRLLQQPDLTNLDNYLYKLKKLKSSLIDNHFPKPQFRAEKPNNELIQLIEEIEARLISGGTVEDKLNSVLAEYVNELESNPFALKAMIEDYSYVYSATTGQSNGRDITKAKKIGDEEYVSYDTVIIDEAARVAPMDLLIALVQAKRRIILVGDHRQLPHMIDENVIKNGDLSEDQFIRQSMFGYLKERAKKLYKFDGIKREITLENQYRTHPLLGQFISDNFYERHGEAFHSPLQDADKFFYQNLKGIEKTPAVWMDVKNSEGSEREAWSRVCEAERIVRELRGWIDSDEGRDLNFGIITFYRNQVNVIEDEFQKEFSKEEREEFRDRLKIGTVDSFQGMEFDIVFLSVVRSRDIRLIKETMKDYQLFGFLISKNRLCVSMSRQKKSLIVVGDREYFETNQAKEHVAELHAFLQLCKEEGKVL
jgi:broad-specificity NMP kinase